MDTKDLANITQDITQVDIETVQTFLQSIALFRQLNVGMFLKKLLKAKMEKEIDLSRIGKSEELKRYFFHILEEVAREVDEEKIEAWKNAAIRLTLEMEDFDFKPNFVRTLRDLTAFDLNVLHRIYIAPHQHGWFRAADIAPLLFPTTPDAYVDMVMQAIKRLASHNLINETFDQTAIIGREDNQPILDSFYYSTNKLGTDFLRFVSDYDEVVNKEGSLATS